MTLKYNYLQFNILVLTSAEHCDVCYKPCIYFDQSLGGWDTRYLGPIIPEDNDECRPLAGVPPGYKIVDTPLTKTKSATYLVPLYPSSNGCAEMHGSFPIENNEIYPATDLFRSYRVPGVTISNDVVLICPCRTYTPAGNVGILDDIVPCPGNGIVGYQSFRDPCFGKGKCEPIPRAVQCRFPGVIEIYRILSTMEDGWIYFESNCDIGLYGKGEEQIICKKEIIMGEGGWQRYKAIESRSEPGLPAFTISVKGINS